jgi:hypothetical protein
MYDFLKTLWLFETSHPYRYHCHETLKHRINVPIWSILKICHYNFSKIFCNFGVYLKRFIQLYLFVVSSSSANKYGKMTPRVSEWLDFFFWIVFYVLKAYFKSFRGVK